MSVYVVKENSVKDLEYWHPAKVTGLKMFYILSKLFFFNFSASTGINRLS